MSENFNKLKIFRQLFSGKSAEEKTGRALQHEKTFLAGDNGAANMNKINHTNHLSLLPKFNKSRKEECVNSIIPKSKMKKKSRKRTAKKYHIRYKKDTKNFTQIAITS